MKGHQVRQAVGVHITPERGVHASLEMGSALHYSRQPARTTITMVIRIMACFSGIRQSSAVLTFGMTNAIRDDDDLEF